MKKFMEEFKAFVMRGNVVDMAVGIIIGSAFTAIVSSLVDDIINPIIGCFGSTNFDNLSVKLVGDATLNYGSFITAVINFLIMALVLFVILKLFTSATGKLKKNEPEPEPTEKECPYCKTMIAIGATRCPNCTSKLEGFLPIDKLTAQMKAEAEAEVQAQ